MPTDTDKTENKTDGAVGAVEIRMETPAQLGDAARRFLEAAGGRRVFAFEGEMGAGKTTFIRRVCLELGVGDDVASPTFSIVNEYHDAAGEPVYHFDFYRIDDLREAEDIGLDGYFDSDAYCFMEWPRQVEPLLPDDTVWVSIDAEPDGTRVLRMEI